MTYKGPKYKGEGNLCIRYWMNKKGFTSSELSRFLQISKPTFYKILNKPSFMSLKQLCILSGLFGIPVEEFLYCIIRNKPKVKTKEDRWYLSDVREKGNKLFPKESPEE